MRTDTNERAEVKEIRGVAADTLSGALKEMEAVASGARTTKPFYHASINTRADEKLTDEQRTEAIDQLEKALGLTGQPRVVVIHEKEDREHCHIVWSRIDIDRMAAISDSHNYRKHEEVARDLERKFGHERVQGAHAEREGKERPERTPSHVEMLQAARIGVPIKDAKELMTGIWRNSKSGKEFQTGLEKQGWTLARGDRRDFVAIDPRGGVHSVARRIEGAKAVDVRNRFSDLDPKKLRSVVEAKKFQRGRHGAHTKQKVYDMKGQARPRTAKSRSSVATAAQTPRTSNPTRRVAGSVASRVGGSLFSALMGEKPAPAKKSATPQHKAAEDAQSQRRQDFLRQLSREVTPEGERDAENERDRGRERTRR
jgi:hypothetical protein